MFGGLGLGVMPPLLGYNRVQPIAEGEVLAEVRETGDPLVAVRRCGAGRSLAFMSDPAALEAGDGEQVITPPLGTELAGYGFYLARRAERVLDDLRVRCVCVGHGRTWVFLISCDLIGFAVDAADRHRRRIAERWGVPVGHVLLACTHTHSGPATKTAIGLGEVDPGSVAGLPGWIDEAVEGVRLGPRPVLAAGG